MSLIDDTDKPGRWSKSARRKLTPQQARAIQNIMSGKFKHAKDAMLAAGYKPGSASHPKHLIFDAVNVQKYLAEANLKFRKKHQKDLPEAVMDTYVEGLEATKVSSGRRQIVHPDFLVRKQYADAFSKFFGWETTGSAPGDVRQQFNFFSVDKEKQEKFNDKLKSFLKSVQSGP